MSEPSRAVLQPIENKGQLVADLERGIKPRDLWRIGTEHEKFGYRLADFRPLDYESATGIRSMLMGLQEFGWTPIVEAGNIIGLKQNGASITLEPGGQFELSGAPVRDLHETCSEVHNHLAQVRKVASDLGVGFLGLGFDPKWKREEIPIMPKGRYGIMLRYMPTKGSLGQDMMLRSSTVQVNMDFESEADMVKKFRIGLALQPVVTAMFANSPFTEGLPNGYMSFRSHLWTDTDQDRTGVLPFVFDDGMSFEAYVDYALDVPMYFVYRDGKYIDVAGQSFREFMKGLLPGFPGELPTMQDWSDHLTTLFPEVRLKQFLEMRGADGGPWARLCALPAIWVGLLYDSEAQEATWSLVKNISIEEIQDMRANVPKLALKAPFREGTLNELARNVLNISELGLKNRARGGVMSTNETEYLDPLRSIVETGKSPAENLLERYRSAWGGSIEPIYAECSY